MTNAIYRKAMFSAFSVPVALFLVLPFATLLLLAPQNLENLVSALGTLAALLGPLYLVGFWLAPWSGRRVQTTKVPAFLMAAAA